MPIPARSAGSWSALVAVGILVLGPPAAADDRGTELMRYHCSSSLGRRDVTLFANGTVRLRQGPWNEQELYLDELLREELASYVERLRDVRSSALVASAETSANGVSGDWVEDCEIRLALPGAEPASYSFSAFDVPPLVVAGLIHVAEDLAEYTRPPDLSERLPEGYRPQPGDVLINAEGRRFRVVAPTGDGLAVELVEIGSPVMIFVAIEELGDMFSLEEAEVR